MTTLAELQEALARLDGQGYRAYKSIQGSYRAPSLVLCIDHVQGDPFAEPSRFRALVEADAAALPEWAVRDRVRRRGAADFLNRVLAAALGRAPVPTGSGRSGELRILVPGQQVLDRTSLLVHEDGRVESRFRAGLPARGRRILGPAAAELVAAANAALEASLFYAAVDGEALRRHVEAVEDAVRLRAQLRSRGLVAFVAEGSRLPRLSGVDDRPLTGDAVVEFEAPSSLGVTLDAPNAGPVHGMGIPEGVTLIVGGGYHGKSTLLRAIERGVYDHIPGDGRERVVAVADAVKVRAEDGRRVAGTDISNFIGRLPSGARTAAFRTDNASGSTSQAAAIVEALEVGAQCLLLDEDTSATNFMIRDARMQALIASGDEPITPFIDRARQLYEERAVSTVVVVGGSGDYFDIADTVIAMREYRPAEVTAAARRVAERLPTHRVAERGPWSPLRARSVDPSSIRPGRGHRAVHLKTWSPDRVEFGEQQVDLAAVEQIVEAAQTRAMAHALVHAVERAFEPGRPLPDALRIVMDDIERRGLDVVHPRRIGELAAFRIHELAALLARLRTLRTVPAEAEP